jgi:hypothetical protein
VTRITRTPGSVPSGALAHAVFRPAVVALLASAALAAPASAQEPTGNFGRLFGDSPGFVDPTNQQLADLAQTMLDPNADSGNNAGVPSGFTYFGQFIDHDLTLDTTPSPTEPVDPATLPNRRSFRLDLDSLYAGGPGVSPQLYDGDRFLVQEANLNGVRDLPRDENGSAILVEARNDENQILSQIHVAMLKAHNRLIDEGRSFADAQRILRWHYQYAVLNDWLPHITSNTTSSLLANLLSLNINTLLSPGLLGQVLRAGLPLELRRMLANPSMTPIEFAVAAFRFGHSQVRRAYRLNEINGFPNFQVFSLTDPLASLMGGRALHADRQIDWRMFFDDLGPDPSGGLRNLSRRVDALISSSLFQLPIPGAAGSGSNVLAFRNMVRGKMYFLPSGQEVARRMGIQAITPAQLNLGPGFERGTPLWFYILAEAQNREFGQRLGPVGSRLVTSTFFSVLANDPGSYLRSAVAFVPDPAIAGADGQVSVSDLFAFAGVV